MSTHEAPVWRTLLQAALDAHVDRPESRFAQLATVRGDGRPANRTVNFRFFLDAPDRLVFTTDTRSAKVAQIAANPWGELCWYFAGTREQFRISGRLEVIAEPVEAELVAARERAWRERSDASRQSFTWPEPGAPRAEAEAFEGAVPGEPPGVFALLVLTVEGVEHLELRAAPHVRTVYRLGGEGWTTESVNP